MAESASCPVLSQSPRRAGPSNSLNPHSHLGRSSPRLPPPGPRGTPFHPSPSFSSAATLILALCSRALPPHSSPSCPSAHRPFRASQYTFALQRQPSRYFPLSPLKCGKALSSYLHFKSKMGHRYPPFRPRHSLEPTSGFKTCFGETDSGPQLLPSAAWPKPSGPSLSRALRQQGLGTHSQACDSCTPSQPPHHLGSCPGFQTPFQLMCM